MKRDIVSCPMFRRATRNFRGQGSNPRKRGHQNFLKEDKASEHCFQIRKWRKYCGWLSDSVPLKANGSYYNFLSRQGRKKGAGSEASGKHSE